MDARADKGILSTELEIAKHLLFRLSLRFVLSAC